MRRHGGRRDPVTDVAIPHRRLRGRADPSRYDDVGLVVPAIQEVDPASDDRDGEQATEPDPQDVERHERHWCNPLLDKRAVV